MPRHTTQLHFRTLLRRCFSSSTTTSTTLHPQLSLSKPSFPSPPPPSPHHLPHPFPFSSTTTTTPLRNLGCLPFSLSRTFCSQPDAVEKASQDQERDIAGSLSAELLLFPREHTLPLTQRLDLSFSHITLTPSLVLATLNLSPEAGRTVLVFFEWVKSRSHFEFTDEIYSNFVVYFGRRKDVGAIHELLVDGKGITGHKCFVSAIDRLVRAGRPMQTVSFFENMEREYGFVRNMDNYKFVVSKLCEHGFSAYAEKMVNNLANVFFPDEYICDLLIKGWCVDEKLDEAFRLAGEMYRGGFEISTVAYNAILDCLGRVCRKKDPLRLQSETEMVLIEMEEKGVPRDVETFNVLISNLCKIRKTEDAVKLFYRMGEWGCYPNETTFILLIRSLYQAARVGEGDEMIDRMRSAGHGYALDKKAYYSFLKILCGIERIDHAMSVFEMMKGDGCKPGIKTYDLLMGKLVAHGRVDKANDLYKEAESSGVPVEPKAYKLDPRFAKKKPTAVKKEKKRETLPEKMARKRRRLKQIRLSFVKKPKRMMRRAY